MHLLSLIFGVVLLPAAYTLSCYECKPGLSGTCRATVTECPLLGHRCGVARITAYAGDSKLADVSMKTCVPPEDCGFDGSLNYGVSRTVVTSKCCTSDLCNTEPAPEPSVSRPNGRKCFSCNEKHCTNTVNCQGNEDHCISSTVSAGGEKITAKGCASKQMCSVTTKLQSQFSDVIRGEISCCQGDFCNSASSTTAGLLLLVAPLVSMAVLS